MILSDLQKTLSRVGQSYLVLDVNCLFVAASLREEVWLYLQRESAEVLVQIDKRTDPFSIRGVNPDRELSTYSGGEQAVLACLLMITLIHTLDVKKIKLLLCGIFESVSEDNRKRLCQQFEAVAQSHGVDVFQMENNTIRKVLLDACE